MKLMITSMLLFSAVICQGKVKYTYLGSTNFTSVIGNNMCFALESESSSIIKFSPCGSDLDLKLIMADGYQGFLFEPKRGKWVEPSEDNKGLTLSSNPNTQFYSYENEFFYIDSKNRSKIFKVSLKNGKLWIGDHAETVEKFVSLLSVPIPKPKQMMVMENKIEVHFYDLDQVYEKDLNAFDLKFTDSNHLDYIKIVGYGKVVSLDRPAFNFSLQVSFVTKKEKYESAKFLLNEDLYEEKCPAPLLKKEKYCFNCDFPGVFLLGEECSQCEGTDFHKTWDNKCIKCHNYEDWDGSKCVHKCKGSEIFINDKCEKCKENQRVEKDKNLCHNCADGEEPAESQTVCRDCQKGFYSKAGFPCKECTLPKYTNDKINCNKCPSNSIYDETTEDCKVCESNKVPDSNQRVCVDCTDGIIEEGICKKCRSDQIVDTDKKKCVCKAGTEEKTGVCKNCENGFISSQGSACRKCPEHSEPNNKRTKCECSQGYILSGEVCIVCPMGNILDPQGNTCISCPKREAATKNRDACKKVSFTPPIYMYVVVFMISLGIFGVLSFVLELFCYVPLPDHESEMKDSADEFIYRNEDNLNVESVSMQVLQ